LIGGQSDCGETDLSQLGITSLSRNGSNRPTRCDTRRSISNELILYFSGIAIHWVSFFACRKSLRASHWSAVIVNTTEEKRLNL